MAAFPTDQCSKTTLVNIFYTVRLVRILLRLLPGAEQQYCGTVVHDPLPISPSKGCQQSVQIHSLSNGNSTVHSLSLNSSHHSRTQNIQLSGCNLGRRVALINIQETP